MAEDVVLSLGFDTASAEKSISALKRDVSSLFNEKADNMTLKQLESQINANMSKIEELRTKLSQTQQFTPTKSYQNVLSQITETQDKLKELREYLANISSGNPLYEGLAGDIPAVNAEINKLHDKLVALKQKRIEYDNGAPGGSKQTLEYTQTARELDTLISQTSLLSDKYKDLSSSEESAGSSEETFSTRLASGMKKGLASISRLGNAIKQKLSKNFNHATHTIRNFILAGLGIMGISSLVNKLKSTATESLKTMAKQIPEVNEAISSIKTALNGLKGSVGTMIQPLLNAFAPAITNIINLLSQGITKAGEFFAALTGQKYIYKATAAQVDYANSLKNSNKQLGKFDELNNISTQKGDDYSYSQEKVPIETENLAEKLKDMWANADFTELGTLLGTKLQDALNNIPWDEIQEVGKKLGSSVATLINGFVEVPELGTDLGKTTGEALNTFIYTIQSFFDNLDSLAVGEFLADWFNGWLDGVDWSALGSTLSSGLSSLMDILIGFFSETDYDLIGTALVNLIEGFDFTRLILELGMLIWSVLIGAIRLLFSLVGGINKLLGDFFELIGIDAVAGFFHGIADNLKTSSKFLGNWLKSYIIEPVKNFLGIHSPSTLFAELGVYCIQGLINGIKSIINTVVTLFKNVWNTIKDVTSALWISIKTIAIEGIKGIYNVIQTILVKLKSIWDSSWEGFKNVISKIFTGIWNIIKGFINKVIEGFEIMVNGIISSINLVVRGFNSLSVDFPDWVPGVGGKSFGVDIPEISKISIPKLAQGAVIPPNREFMAVLGDQSNGTNIETPLSTMIDAFNAASKGSSEEELQLMREQNELLRMLLAKDNGLSSDSLFRTVRQAAKTFEKSTGLPAF